MARVTGISRGEWVLIWYSAVAHSLVHLLELVFAAVLPFLLVEFSAGLFQMGLVATLAAFAFGLGALPAGVLADRIGPQRLLVACLLATAAAAAAVALSTSLSLLTVSLTGLGLALGLYHPAGMSLISKGVRARSRGLGYHGMGGNIGIAGAPFLGATLALLWGWRLAYLLPGLVAGVVGLSLLFARLKEYPADGSSAVAPASSRSVPGLLVVPLVAVFLIFVFSGFIYRGVLTFLVLHLKENVAFALGGLDALAVAGSFATVALLLGMVGQWLGGTLGDRMRREALLLPMAVGVTISLLLMGLLRDVPLVMVASLFAVFYFMGQPLTTSLIADYSPYHLQGRMYGISFFGGFGLGSLAAGFSGWIAERWNIPAVFLALAVTGALVLALSSYLLLAAWRRDHLTPRKPGTIMVG